MRRATALMLLLFASVLLWHSPPSARLRTSYHPRISPISKSNQYWFQVGAYAVSDNGYADHFGKSVTGASVEIRILNQKMNHLDADASYWVGVDLPNDAFIQAGYMEDSQYNSGRPSWFWEYFRPGTAKENVGGFLGNQGQSAGQNGTWVKFSVTSSGTVWSAFENDKELGKVDLKASNSGTSGPYAVAESAQTYWTDNVLGPVEFRNLSYRDEFGVWYLASAAVSLCCYGATSDYYGGPYPYGVVNLPGKNNYWLAGTGLPIRTEGQYLWPWYYVTVKSPLGTSTGSGWYTADSLVKPQADQIIPISGSERYSLKGWTDGTDTASGFTPNRNISLSAVYVKQYLVTVSSAMGTTYGSGWYDADGTVRIRVTPTSIPFPGILGTLGVSSVATGWEGDYTGSIGSDGSSSIRVSSPMMIHAVWITIPGLILPIITVTALGLVTFTIHHKRIRRDRVQYCLNCGHKLPAASPFCLECGHRQEI